jgi:pyrroloquinoline quinone (PQQ) biosynthesis protein C
MDVIERLDELVDDFSRRTRFFHEPMTLGRARMFVKQHRLNTRQRNSVLKLAVATNCPDWDTRLKIIGSCSQEIIADNEFGGGKAHWQIIEELGVAVGLSLDEIRNEQPLPSTRICWLAWEALMKNRHWLEGLIANTCSERVNTPGYGIGEFRNIGNSGVMRRVWGELFGLTDAQLAFWSIHEEADIAHSNLGWQTIAQLSEEMRMTDAVVEACRQNLLVWDLYFDGICEAGSELDRQLVPVGAGG